jgi:uncharacterized protein YqeY
MTLKSQIQDDVKDAMRARDKERIGALRLLSAAIKQIEVDTREELDDAGVLVVLDKMAKQRRESLEQFEKAGREDLAAKERFELEVIADYLPEPLTDAEVTALVDEVIASTGAAGMQDMGKVMGQLKPQVQGRADMKVLSGLVRERLNA